MEFENIIGNTEAKDYLLNCLRQNNILHSYLFLGTEGIGKFLIAKVFAKKILCLENQDKYCTCKSCLCFDGNNHPDFVIVNEEGETIKIEQIRNLTEKVIEKPIISSKKVYIINDCEKMTKEAQNCLLKTLEEPPEFAVFILISSNENLILNTIKSRCMSIKFRPIQDQILKAFALKNLDYDMITDNLLKAFDGSIGKAIKLKQNQDTYLKIENFIANIGNQDLIDYMLAAKILYDKETVVNLLDYMIVCLFAYGKENKSYIDCIQYVHKALERIKMNCNFDMSLDTMLFEIWEELK